MNPKVDFYFDKAKTWKKEIEQLRTIALDCELTETLKWGCPCYTFPIEGNKQESNIVLIHVFKEYCGLLFFKGALVKDPKGILIQQTENVQAARQMRFTNLRQIVKLKPAIKACIKDAIAIEKAGLKVELKKTSEFAMPEEFKQLLSEDAALKKAFKALTPGRQRAYLLYFSSAKQSKTREARIEKYIPQILEGKGLND
jgi:uncharacterized protein YdeI (YjbR/CyaY-like superfamily)